MKVRCIEWTGLMYKAGNIYEVKNGLILSDTTNSPVLLSCFEKLFEVISEEVKPTIKVRCINTASRLDLTLNKIYEVINESEHCYAIGDEDDEGYQRVCHKDRFEVVTEVELKVTINRHNTVDQLNRSLLNTKKVQLDKLNYNSSASIMFNDNDLSEV